MKKDEVKTTFVVEFVQSLHAQLPTVQNWKKSGKIIIIIFRNIGSYKDAVEKWH